MSKITQALEKAARERLQRRQSQEQPTVATAAPVLMPVASQPKLGEAVPAGQVEIDAHIVCASDPNSPIAEQYRTLRTNFQSLRLRPGSKAILLTSAVNGEGKSVTAVNLALTLARQEHAKIILVDADMRKSSVPKWLGLQDRHVGLSTVLQHGGEVDGALLRLGSPVLTVLPAGPVPEHPTELLASVAFKRLIAMLKTQFDWIIIDAPPVLPVTDPAIMSSQADGVLLIVRSGKTQRKTVLEAQELLKKAKANLLGCILTHMEYYLPYHHYYREYYRKHHQEQKAVNDHHRPSAAGAMTDGAPAS